MMKKHYLFLLMILCLGSFNVFAQDVVDCDPLGCTDATACNYDATATEDDGSCEFAQEDVDNPGFMLTCDGACQDDDDNGICDFNQVGCTDAEACNQSFFACIGEDGIASICPATIDDGSCTYAVLDFNCDGTCVDVDEDGICDKVDDLICANDSDNDGVCDDSEVFSECADPTACNYVAGSSQTYGSDPNITLPGDMEMIDSNNDGLFVCVFPDEWFNCDGTCLDADTDGVCDEVDGCTDVDSFNWNDVAATECCTVAGCTDDTAFNYDAAACFNDGSCAEIVEGCIDETACNFNANANTDDGSCSFAAEWYNCDGTCQDDDADGTCDEVEIDGCTDETAFNYNSLATEDDGSCEEVTIGCYDENAGNYCADCNTECENGDCCEDVVLGCTDNDPDTFGGVACNYDAAANTNDGSCTYAATWFNCDGTCVDLDEDTICDIVDECVGELNDCDDCMDLAGTYVMGTCNGDCVEGDDDGDGVCNDYEVLGCTDANAVNYNENAGATEDDGSCFDPLCDSDWDATTGNYIDGDSDNDGVCDDDEVLGCTDINACNFDAAVGATDDDGSCELPSTGYNCDGSCADTDGDAVCDLADECVGTYDACGVCNGEGAEEYYQCLDATTGEQTCINDTDGDGVCNELEIAGCTDISACNYDMTATEDDGSCEGVVGCDLPYMLNYNPLADEDCEGDDCGTATCIVNDSCIEFVPGCMDDTACNYDETANTDDGSCESDSCAGCMDDTACNYDADATISAQSDCLFEAFVPAGEDCAYWELDTDGDGVLDYMEIHGCTDATACNFDVDATEDDGSCEGACDSCDENGVFTDGDIDNDGVCDNVEIQGCTDEMACNYNPFATELDGSCEGQIGCNTPNAVNYSPDADCFSNELYGNDELCQDYVFGCMDETACNYDEANNFDPATAQGGTSCIYAAASYDCDGNCIEDCDGDGVCDDLEMWGCTDPLACNTSYFDADGNVYVTPMSDDGETMYMIASQDDGSCLPYGCGQVWSFNYDADAVANGCIDNTLCTDWNLGCTDAFACNYDMTANFDDGSCAYASNGAGIEDPICQECVQDADGNYVGVTYIDEDGDGIPDCDSIVVGCMSADACNFNPNAMFDDGSCISEGDVCEIDGAPGTIIDCICVPDDVSIEEVTSSFGLLIYPNPADDYITIELDSYDYEDARITIINQLGQIVVSHTTSTFSTTNINVGNYPTGLYQVSVATEKDIVNKSLLIK